MRTRLQQRHTTRILTWFSIASWAGSFFLFVFTLPHAPSLNPKQCDAIIVLTGDRGRLEHGLVLLAAKKAPHLFVSGVTRGLTPEQVFRYGNGSPYIAYKTLKRHITMGFVARDTTGNAKETQHWLENTFDNIECVRLVTSHYHMPRSLLEFHRALPNVQVIADAVPPLAHEVHWWNSARMWRLTLLEYHKYLLSSVRLLLSEISR